MGINSVQAQNAKLMPGGAASKVAQNAKDYASSLDPDFREIVAKKTAKLFKQETADTFVECSKGGLPADGAPGAKVLAQTLDKYTNFIKELCSEHAKKFARWTIGSNAEEALSQAAKSNTSVGNFVKNLEGTMGDTIKNVIKTTH